MPIKTHIYDNGFGLIYEKSKSSLPLSSINLFVRYGSQQEPPHLRGVSHFIEHMCFKGTKKRLSAVDISIEYDKIGADFNAFTNKHVTCYYFKCDSVYSNKCIEILADLVLHSTFVKKEFDKEHKVVIEENIRALNDSTGTIMDGSEALLYAGSPLANTIDHISYHKANSLNYDDVVEYYKTVYVPHNMFISVVTDQSFETVKRVIQKTSLVRLLPQPQPNPRAILAVPSNFVALDQQRDIVFKTFPNKNVENALLTLSFRVCGTHGSDPDRFVLSLLQNVLSGPMSSRLFAILREKHGLVYSTNIDITHYHNVGGFTIFTQIDKNKLLGKGTEKTLLPVLVDILDDLVKRGITEKELNDAKGYQRGQMLISMEDIDASCYYNGENFLFSIPMMPLSDLYKQCYQPITVKQVNECIEKYFTRDRMSVCVMAQKPPTVAAITQCFAKFSPV